MDIENRLRTFIVEQLRWNGAPEDLTDEFPLIEQNVIDSLGVLEVSAFLQTTYDIVIEDEELVVDNFRSLSAVARFVTSKIRTPGVSIGIPPASQADQAATYR
jgi:acyl carrier protein